MIGENSLDDVLQYGKSIEVSEEGKKVFHHPDVRSHQDLAANTSLPEAHDRRAFEGRRSALLREILRFVLPTSCN